MKLWLMTEGHFQSQTILFEDESLLIIRAPTEADAIAVANKAMTQGLVRSRVSFNATELNLDGPTEVVFSICGWEYSED